MLKILTREEYERRAAESRRVAVFREFLADRETPVAALSRLGEDEECFLLESVAGGETRGRYSFLGIEPCAKVEGADALEDLRRRFAECRYAAAPELPPFQGGAVGYIAYDAMVAGDLPFTMFYSVFLLALTQASLMLADIMYAVVDPRVRVN